MSKKMNKRKAKEIMESYRSAAEQGDAEAQYNLGCCYANAVKPDYVKAAKWFTKAAKQGHIDAQLDLGNCYMQGKGVDQNNDEAIRWYESAAEGGNDEAQFLSGAYYIFK